MPKERVDEEEEVEEKKARRRLLRKKILPGALSIFSLSFRKKNFSKRLARCAQAAALHRRFRWPSPPRGLPLVWSIGKPQLLLDPGRRSRSSSSSPRPLSSSSSPRGGAETEASASTSERRPLLPRQPRPPLPGPPSAPPAQGREACLPLALRRRRRETKALRRPRRKKRTTERKDQAPLLLRQCR